MFAYWSLTLDALAATSLVPSGMQAPTQSVDTTPSWALVNALTVPLQSSRMGTIQ